MIRSFVVMAALVWGLAGPGVATELAETQVAPDSAQETLRAQADARGARAWELSVEEHQRYRELMRGVRGSFSVPTISPLEVLGIHADTEEERRRYAERLVRMLHADTERVLAFQRAVDGAWERLYGHEAMFDVSRFPPGSRPLGPAVFAGRRLVAFVTTSCAACREAMPRLLALAGESGPAAGLDIYVVDTEDEKSIRAWAHMVGVDPALVHQRRYTLNYGRALFERVSAFRAVPQVFVRDGDRLTPVPALSAVPEDGA